MASDSRKISIADAVRAGIAFHRQGKLEEAEVFYRGVLEEVPDHPDALHFLGVMRHQQGSPDEAVALIERAIAIAPGDAGMRLNLGNVLRRTGRNEEAEAAYRAALEIEPEMADAHCNLGVLLRSRGQLEEARVSLERAIELNPRHGEALFNQGKVLADLGQIEAAKDSFRRAVNHQEAPSARGEASSNLAKLLHRNGNTEQAIAVLKDWVARSPDSAMARHQLAAISQESVPERCEEEYVVDLFDRMAPSFDRQLGNLYYRAPKLIVEAVEDLLEDRRKVASTLDLGCGTGLAGEIIAPLTDRLVGVDLAPAMLARARAKGIYDELVEDDIVHYLNTIDCRYDLILAADVFVYLGDLGEVLRGVADRLDEDGLVCFTVEKAASVEGGKGYRLEPHGRYAHQKFYLEKTAQEAGLRVIRIEDCVVRLEGGEPVVGFVVALGAGVS